MRVIVTLEIDGYRLPRATHARTRVRSFWSRSLRSGTLRSRSSGSEAKFGHFGSGHYGPGHFGRGYVLGATSAILFITRAP